MRKKDSIFWLAAAVFLAALVITAFTGDQRYLYLLVVSVFVRPTLAELGLIRRNVDERQLQIYYRSGNLAFAAMIVAAVVMAIVHTRGGTASWEAFTFIVVVGLASKTLFNVVLAKNYRAAGPRVVVGVGLLSGILVLVDNGASLAGLTTMGTALVAALLLVASGCLAPKFPKTVGAVTFGVAFYFIWIIARNSQSVFQAATVLLICVALLLAAASLFAFGRSGDAGSRAADVPADRG